VEKLPLPRPVMKPVVIFWDIHGAPKLCLLVLCIYPHELVRYIYYKTKKQQLLNLCLPN
jgi:hypothetical protein